MSWPRILRCLDIFVSENGQECLCQKHYRSFWSYDGVCFNTMLISQKMFPKNNLRYSSFCKMAWTPLWRKSPLNKIGTVRYFWLDLSSTFHSYGQITSESVLVIWCIYTTASKASVQAASFLTCRFISSAIPEMLLNLPLQQVRNMLSATLRINTNPSKNFVHILPHLFLFACRLPNSLFIISCLKRLDNYIVQINSHDDIFLQMLQLLQKYTKLY